MLLANLLAINIMRDASLLRVLPVAARLSVVRMLWLHVVCRHGSSSCVLMLHFELLAASC